MKLKQFKINSGGRFTPQAPIVIDFSKSKMVGMKGDQETGKTTVEELLLMTLGQLGGQEVIDALKNKENGLIDTELQFEGNDRAAYDIKNKNGRLTIKREGEPTVGGPQALVKKVLGVAGISPLEIKNESIEKIVKWLASYSTKSAEEFEKDMLKIKNDIKQSKKDRAEANKSAKGLREYLFGEGYVDDKGELIESAWKESEKTFKVKPDIDKLSAELKSAGDKSDKFVQFETKLSGRRDRKKQIEAEIKKLQEELDEVDQNIKDGDAWIEKNKTAKKDYDDVRKRYDNAAKDVADYNLWVDVKKKKKEMEQFQDLSIAADNNEKAAVKKQQELQWEVIPDIRGVEILLEDTHEEEGEMRKAGFYYNGLNSRQLSASEWFGLVIQILKKNKIKIIVIDDTSQFGSKFMELLEKLSESGCYILYSEMSRGTEILEIEYK